MEFIAALVVIAYLAIGCFIAGFIDVDPRESNEFMLFVGTLLLWPAGIIALVCIVVFGVPIFLGRKIGAKYLPPCAKFIGKIIDREVD